MRLDLLWWIRANSTTTTEMEDEDEDLAHVIVNKEDGKKTSRQILSQWQMMSNHQKQPHVPYHHKIFIFQLVGTCKGLLMSFSP